jgi:hypothetical protein
MVVISFVPRIAETGYFRYFETLQKTPYPGFPLWAL